MRKPNPSLEAEKIADAMVALLIDSCIKGKLNSCQTKEEKEKYLPKKNLFAI